MTIVFAVINWAFKQMFAFNWHIGPAEVVVVAGAELVLDNVVVTNEVVEPWLDVDDKVVELPDVEDVELDDVVETGMGPTLTLDDADVEELVADEPDDVLRVDVLVVEGIIGLSMALGELVVVDTEDVDVLVLWMVGPRDADELAEDVEVLRLEEVELLVLGMIGPCDREKLEVEVVVLTDVVVEEAELVDVVDVVEVVDVDEVG